jgi:hypothetical protein
MNKEASIGDFKLGTIPSAWRKGTINPIGSALVAAGLTAIPAYYAAPWLGKKMIQTVVPEKYRQEAMEDFENPENQKNLRWKAAGVAAALTGLGHLGMSYNPGRKGINSLTSWYPGEAERKELEMEKPAMETLMAKESLQYFLNAPAFGDSRIFGTANGVQGMPPVALNQNTAPLFGIGNSSSFGDTTSLLNTPVVPLNHSSELIETDPYLNNRQKGVILNIFDHTAEGGRSGLVSASDLASGAVRAGFGYGAGSVAGLVLGSLFSLPTRVTQKLSQIGGIANAVVNTGIVGV